MHEQHPQPLEPDGTARALGSTVLEQLAKGSDTPAGFLHNLRVACCQELVSIRGFPTRDHRAFMEDFAEYRLDHPKRLRYYPKDPGLNYFSLGACRFAMLIKRPLALKSLYETSLLYLQDVAVFAHERIPHPEKVAVYHGPGILGQIEDACIDVPFFNTPSERVSLLAKRIHDPLGWLAYAKERARKLGALAPVLCTEYGYPDEIAPERIQALAVTTAEPEAALRHRLASRNFFLETYPSMPPSAVEPLVNGLRTWTDRLLNQRLADARIPPAEITLSAEGRATGIKQLDTIFAHTRAAGLWKEDILPWESYELMRQLYGNRQNFSGDRPASYQDLEDYVRLFRSYQRAHRKNSPAETQDISSDTHTQAAIFDAYMQNLAQLQHAGISEPLAKAAAQFTLASSFEQLVAAVEQHDPSCGRARKFIKNRMRIPLVSTRMQQRMAEQFPQLGGDVSQHLLTMHADNPDQLFAVARQYTTMFDTLLAGIKALVPQATAGDVEWFFTHTARPLESLALWADASRIAYTAPS